MQLLIFSPHFFADCAHVFFWNRTFTYHFHLIYHKCSQLKHYVPFQALQGVYLELTLNGDLKNTIQFSKLNFFSKENKPKNQTTEHLPGWRAGSAVEVWFLPLLPQVKLCTNYLFKFLQKLFEKLGCEPAEPYLPRCFSPVPIFLLALSFRANARRREQAMGFLSRGALLCSQRILVVVVGANTSILTSLNPRCVFWEMVACSVRYVYP